MAADEAGPSRAPTRAEASFGSLRDDAPAFAQSFNKWFFLAAGLGGVTGFGVAGSAIIAEGFAEASVLDARLIWIFLLAPIAGLAVAWFVIRYLTPDRSSESTEAFIDDYHSPTRHLDWRSIPGKIIAAIATIGSGGSMGFEGPSIYLGAATGATEQQIFAGSFAPHESKVLSVSGAAAGLSAIFRAPLTGVMFAVEGPYMFDLVRFAVAPSLTAAAVSYLVYTAIRGTTPFFQVNEHVPLELSMLGAAILVGVVCALATRVLLLTIRGAGALLGSVPTWAKIVIAGGVVGGLGAISFWLTGLPLTLGEGVVGAQKFLAGDVTSDVMPLGALFVVLVLMKMAATAASIKGGGVGGVFFPLSFMGAGIGAAFHVAFDLTESTFFPVIGIAGMISAAFRAPLTAVAFIAETTGNTSYLIPGLLAAATATSLMGRKTISAVQAQHPTSAVTAARRIPLRKVVAGQTPRVVSPEMPLSDYAAGPYETPAVVEENGRFVGLMTKDRLFDCHLQDRHATTVGEVMDDAPLVLPPRMALRDAVARIVAGDKRCAVVLDKGSPTGIVTDRDILRGQEARRLASGAEMD